MVRVALWKVGSEWATLRRILWPRDDRRVYYFAFGANLSDAVLARRRIRVFEQTDFRLEDVALRFTQPGFHRDQGYASADPAPGECIYGRLLLIRESDAVRMDYFEGVPFIGAHEKCYHEQDGVRFFYYRTTRIIEGLSPTSEYLEYIVEALRGMSGVPRDHVDSLASTRTLAALQPQDRATLFGRGPVLKHWPRTALAYERVCLRLIEWLWHRSLLQQMVRE